MNRTATIHKRWTAVIIAVLAVLLCAVVFSFSGCNQRETMAAGEPMVTTIHNTEHMRLTSATTASDNSVTITATVYPENATNKDVSWSLAWADASSSWATGKTVSDYVSMTSDASSATLTCVQAFGEQIILTASISSGLSATVTLDFEKRLDDINFILKRDSVVLDSVLFSQFYMTHYESDYFSTRSVSDHLDVNVDGTVDEHTYSLEVEPVFSDFTLDSSDNHNYSFRVPDPVEFDSYVTVNETMSQIISDFDSYFYGNRNIEEFNESCKTYNSYINDLGDSSWELDLKEYFFYLSSAANNLLDWSQNKPSLLEGYGTLRSDLPKYYYNGSEYSFSTENSALAGVISASGYGVEFIGPHGFRFGVSINLNNIPLPAFEVSLDNSSVVF